MRIALNAAAGLVHAFCATEAPLGLPEEISDEFRAEVLPAAGEDGALATRDGRVQKISDAAALVDRLNAQQPEVRVDFDHESEPRARTHRGSTAAEGWLSAFQLEANGAITALFKLRNWALHRVRSREFRYTSPAVWMNQENEIMQVSSVALVNNPNFVLQALNNDAPTDPSNPPAAGDVAARETAANERMEAAERLMMNAATRAVDQAIADKRLAPAQKDFVLNSIKTHAEGIEKGIEAFEAAFPASSPTPGLNNLDRRVGPRGAPDTDTAAPAIRTPQGIKADDESLELHARVAAHARDRGISYRDAVVELGALS